MDAKSIKVFRFHLLLCSLSTKTGERFGKFQKSPSINFRENLFSRSPFVSFQQMAGGQQRFEHAAYLSLTVIMGSFVNFCPLIPIFVGLG
jgi:hypothetical protein